LRYVPVDEPPASADHIASVYRPTTAASPLRPDAAELNWQRVLQWTPETADCQQRMFTPWKQQVWCTSHSLSSWLGRHRCRLNVLCNQEEEEDFA